MSVRQFRMIRKAIRTSHSSTSHLHTSGSVLSPSSIDFLAPPQPVADLPRPVLSSRDRILQRKLEDITNILSWSFPSPSRVWAHYVDALNTVSPRDIPLQIHQSVLRQCTPVTAELRFSAARRLRAGNRPKEPHMHEGRFRAVIRNIRAAGYRPSLGDYEFILEQFAAAGHHTGAMHVYAELLQAGQEPRSKTFGLCLQAIAHRLTLPVARSRQSRLIAETQSQCSMLLKDMEKYRKPLTSVNLDLALRILKETVDEAGFELLLKVGYGIDLAYPDRRYIPALDSHRLSELGSGLHNLPTPQPFSTATLNTTLDMLGRFGNVSKLVSAFEVLTQPLPPQASRHLSSTFEDDEDVYVNPPAPLPLQLPHAKPNTVSYNILLKHVSRAGHATFARHYVLDAMDLDRRTDRALRNNILNLPLPQVSSPHFAINRGTLLSPFGNANRDKHVSLMRWVQSKLPTMLRRKQNDLRWYSRLRDVLQQDPSLSQRPASEYLDAELSGTVDVDQPPLAGSSRPRAPKPSLPTVFELDVASETLPSLSPEKRFDLDTHLRILERDIFELGELMNHSEDILGRTVQRVKERLGRRVWEGQDIYLSFENRRRLVTRRDWSGIVRFKARKGYIPQDQVDSRLGGGRRLMRDTAPHALIRPGSVAGLRGFSSLRFTNKRRC